jgi:hypothetical protein
MPHVTFKTDSDRGTFEMFVDGKYVGDITEEQAAEIIERLQELLDD